MVKPEKKFKVGACSASIFVNEIETGVGIISVKNVSLQKTFKNKEGDFQSNSTFKINDIPKAILALKKAYEYLVLENKKGEKQE